MDGNLINACVFPASCEEMIPALSLCHSNTRNDRSRQQRLETPEGGEASPKCHSSCDDKQNIAYTNLTEFHFYHMACFIHRVYYIFFKLLHVI